MNADSRKLTTEKEIDSVETVIAAAKRSLGSRVCHVAVLVQVRPKQVLTFVDALPSELCGKTHLTELGSDQHNFVARSSMSLGTVLNAIAMHRIRVPLHRSSLTAVLHPGIPYSPFPIHIQSLPYSHTVHSQSRLDGIEMQQ
jgi:hypothetical protein